VVIIFVKGYSNFLKSYFETGVLSDPGEFFLLRIFVK